MLLAIEGVAKRFGALTAIDALSLGVADGEALGIIGPNGAGKSTLFNLVTGAVRADAGRIWYEGSDITESGVHERCRRGIGRSYQIPHPFAGMTVFENLLVGAAFGRGLRERQVYDDCAAVLERTSLLAKANRLAGSLTLLERKRLELARALATGPRLLLLDEIAGGLTDGECRDLIGTIREIHSAGTTIVWIEHVVHALLAVVGRLAVLNFGRLIAEGEPATVMKDSEVQTVYMGISAETEAG